MSGDDRGDPDVNPSAGYLSALGITLLLASQEVNRLIQYVEPGDHGIGLIVNVCEGGGPQRIRLQMWRRYLTRSSHSGLLRHGFQAVANPRA